VLPNEDYLAIGRCREGLADQIRQALPRIVTPIWEEVARHHVLVADVHYALFTREFGQVRESAEQEPGFHFFMPGTFWRPRRRGPAWAR